MSECVARIVRDIEVVGKYIPEYPRYMTGKELSEKACLSGDQDVRYVVNKARRKGVPILSSKKGYSLATDAKQIADCVTSLIGRINSMNEAIRGLCCAYQAFNKEVRE